MFRTIKKILSVLILASLVIMLLPVEPANAAIHIISYYPNTGIGLPINFYPLTGMTHVVKDIGYFKSGSILLGYNTQADGLGTSYRVGESFTARENLSLYAQWKSPGSSLTDTCKITYYLDGANGPKLEFTVEYGSRISIIDPTASPYNYKKAGYVFRYFTTEANGCGLQFDNLDNMVIVEDLILYAHWSKETTYTLTYEPNNPTGGAKVEYKGLYAGKQTVVDQKFTRSGHIFAQKYSKGSPGGLEIYSVGSEINVQSDTVLYALWLEAVTITYNPNNGTGSVKTVSVEKGGNYKAIDQSYTRNGYNFNGYNTVPDGTGTAYKVGSTIKVLSNTTLYAQWTKKIQTVKITYAPNGGIGAQYFAEPNIGSDYTVNESVFSRDNYIFAGYNTQPGGGGTAYVPGAVFKPSVDITLYAQWTKIPEVTITYNPNGGSVITTDFVIKKGDEHTIVDMEYIRDNYIFTKSYNTMPDGSGTTYNSNDTVVFTNNVTLYAQWTENPQINIRYEPNKGLGAAITIPSNRGGDYTVKSWNYTRSGYFLADYYTTQPDGGGTTYNVNETYKISNDITLYAQWIPKTSYTVYYYPNDETFSSNFAKVDVVYEGDMYTVKGNTFQRSGYRFANKYSTVADGSGTKYKLGHVLKVSGDLHLYAMWQKDYDRNDGVLRAALTKCLKLINGSRIPATSFSFEAEKLFEDYNVPSPNMPDILIGDIEYPNESGMYDSYDGYNYFYYESEELLGDIVWPHPGVYTYKITENEGNYTGDGEKISYSKAMYQLTVVVSNEDKNPANGIFDIIEVTTTIFNDDAGNALDDGMRAKVDATPSGNNTIENMSRMIFTNEYRKNTGGTDPTNQKHWRLSVSNKVNGLMSDETAYFKYNMTVSAPANDTSSENYMAFIVEPEDSGSAKTYRTPQDPVANGADTSGIIAFVPGENTTFYLKNNQYLVFLDLPNGAGYTVTELEDSNYIPGASVTSNGELSAFESRTESTNLEIPSKSNTVIKDPLYIGPGTNSVDFTNTRVQSVATGLNLTSLPFALLLALALSSLVICFTIKANRKKDSIEE